MKKTQKKVFVDMTPTEAYEAFLKGRDAENDVNFVPGQRVKKEYDFADMEPSPKDKRKNQKLIAFKMRSAAFKSVGR